MSAFLKAPARTEPSLDAHLGDRVRRRRQLMGLTQTDLARAVGVRFQQIQKYECAANRMSASRLYAIACALDAPVAYFFAGYASDHHTSDNRPRFDGLNAKNVQSSAAD
ncbi:MAG: helix-turn-helix domain-containing protein [Maricaulaceae bacterium]